MFSKARRQFLVSSSAAAAAGVGFRGVHAQEQKKESDSPSEQLNAAIIGTGGRGGTHIQEMLKAKGVTITHICEVDEGVANSRAEQIGKKQGRKPNIIKDVRKLVEVESVDVVSIATPNHWHALGGVWAMQNGKDAYIEKPVCHNIAEGAALIAAARKNGRVCQVGTQCRSSTAVNAAVDFIREGGIGEVNFARGLCYKRRKSIGDLGDYPIPSKVNFDLWSGPAQYSDPKLTRQRFHYDWHWQRLYGNGDLGNQGPHQTDIARWGLGIDSHPSKITSFGGRLGYPAERNNPDYIDAGDTANTEVTIYDYGEKSIVFETRGLSVDNSGDEELNRLFDSKKGNKIGVVFYGSEGYVVQRSYGYCVAYDKNFNVIKEFRHQGDLNAMHFGNFLEACRSRNASILTADVREGHLSAGMSHLGNISYYLGEKAYASVEEIHARLDDVSSLDDNQATLERTARHLADSNVDLDKTPLSMGPTLEFDPEKEVFTNHEAANELLTREYREGYRCPTAAEV